MPRLAPVVLIALATWIHVAGGLLADDGRPQLAVGGLPAPPAITAVGQADTTLKEATERLERYHSLAAEVACEVALFDKQLRGQGKYREERSGPIPKIRLELKMPLGDEKTGVLVEVCNGSDLWSYRELFDDKTLTHVDLQRVAQELGQDDQPVSMETMTGTIGMGGLAGYMKELRRNFQFEVLGQSQFLGEPTLQLRGSWPTERLLAMLPDQKHIILRGDPPDYSKLPVQLPSHVYLTLGRDNLLPYRIEYRRAGRPPARKPQKSKSKTPAASLGDVTLALEWFHIRINGPMNASDFEYQPGDVEYSKRTESVIKRLRERNKREEAAKAEEQSEKGRGAAVSLGGTP